MGPAVVIDTSSWSPSTFAEADTRSMPERPGVDAVTPAGRSRSPVGSVQRVARRSSAPACWSRRPRRRRPRRRCCTRPRRQPASTDDGGERATARRARVTPAAFLAARRRRVTSKQASAPAADDVERRQLAEQRDAGHGVAALAHQAGQALALGAEHEAHRLVGDLEVEQVGVAAHVEADHPHAGVAQLAQRGGQAADERHRQVLDGAGRRLGDRGGDVHGPVLRAARRR